MTSNMEDYIIHLRKKLEEARIGLKNACSRVDNENIDMDLVHEIGMYAQRIEYFGNMIIDFGGKLT